jgi:hypothetical protein
LNEARLDDGFWRNVLVLAVEPNGNFPSTAEIQTHYQGQALLAAETQGWYTGGIGGKKIINRISKLSD